MTHIDAVIFAVKNKNHELQVEMYAAYDTMIIQIGNGNILSFAHNEHIQDIPLQLLMTIDAFDKERRFQKLLNQFKPFTKEKMGNIPIPDLA